MPARTHALVIAAFALVSTISAHRAQADAPSATPADVTGAAYRMEPAWLVSIHVPSEDADQVLAAAAAAVGLEYGKYDHVAYLDAPGLEQYRPLDGSKAGQQSAPGRTPTTNVSFSLPRDPALLKKALDAVYGAHSYEEPVIYVSEVWRSRSTNPDEQNPNRWWNRQP